MHQRALLQAAIAAATLSATSYGFAQDNSFSIGLIPPMAGQQATTGRQILQKVRDGKSDALFVPSGAGAVVMKQFLERGVDKAGVKLIAHIPCGLRSERIWA